MFESFKYTRSGKKFGNSVADVIGIQRGLYHAAMEQGGCHMHLLKLAEMKEEGLNLIQVAFHSMKFLDEGLKFLEKKWGNIPKISNGKEAIEKFRSTYEGHLKEDPDNQHVATQFESKFNLIQTYLMMAQAFNTKDIESITPEQKMRYLAFELGLIEFFDRNHLSHLSGYDKDITYHEFIRFYSIAKYRDDADKVFEFWNSLTVNCDMLHERKLGYDAVRDHTNSDGTQN
ncbi:hypothetical protein A3741_26860, partial [Oleiphilus sp. HI0069]